MSRIAKLLGLMSILLPPALPAQEAPAAAAEPAGDLEKVEEVLVVTASRTEQPVHEVPAAITVLTAEQIEQIPADDYGDYLRNVPGLNVSQMSARDIQITGRAATNSLATSQLVLMDNRTLYLDFFGFVMWDFVPLDPQEIKQIEVVRGPGSAVWGANAMSGVINLITKPPKEMRGTSVTLGAGNFGTAYGSVTHAGVSGKLGYKLAASYFEQEPYDRPTGIIPGSVGPTNPNGTPYPDFVNQGTDQPKLNLRFDYDQSDDTTWSFAGGYASTEGIIHSGIGPFDIDRGSLMSYVKADWTRRATRFSFFVNVLDGEATNLLARDATGRPIAFQFQSETYNLDFSDTRVLGERNVLTWGATARRNDFDLSIAPAGDKREEYGFFIQDEILLGDKVRWLIGGRWDDIDPIGTVVSPRTSLLFSPKPNHTFRVSYNRAFRAPSMINNFLDVTIVNLVVLPPIPPFTTTPTVLILPSQAVGNSRLQEERLDAYEVGYVGTFGPTTFTLSVYRNKTTDSTDFFQSLAYSSAFPPPGWPFPPFLLDVPPPFGFAGLFPLQFNYRNIGEIEDQGVELSLNYQPSPGWSFFFNYSYQDEPTATGIDRETLPNGTVRDAINTPPEHRANVGAAYNGPRFFASGNVNSAAEAFWTDIFGPTFWGPTDAYTQVNLSLGVRLADERVTLSLIGQNVFDEEIQQHVFGDLLDRKVTGQLRFRF